MAQEIPCPQRGRRFYSVQGFDNPIEYDVPRIYNLVPKPPPWPQITMEPYNPGYVINPETGELEWTEWPYESNPSYPGHFEDKPIRVLPYGGEYSHNAYTNSGIAIGIQSGTAEIIGTAGNPNLIVTLNPPYEGLSFKAKDVAKVSMFREGQLIDIIQNSGMNATSLPDMPPKPTDPNQEWLFTFNTYTKNSTLNGQEVKCTFGTPLVTENYGYLNGVIKTTSSGTEYDTITISVTNAVIYGGVYNYFLCSIVNPIKLKCQYTGSIFDTNLDSETVGREDIYFDIYEVENRVEGTLGNWRIEWQNKTLVPYFSQFTGQTTWDIGSSNYVQNENYTARLCYSYNSSPSNWQYGSEYYLAKLELFNQIIDTVVISNTDYLKSGYTDYYYNCKWTLKEDEEINKPWKNNTISFKYYFWKTVITTTYSTYTAYPDYITDPDYPWGGRPTTTYVNTIEDGESITKTFEESDFDINSPNYSPYSVWGLKPEGELTKTNYAMKYRPNEYENHFIQFTFYRWDSLHQEWYPDTQFVPTLEIQTLKAMKNVNRTLQDKYVYSMMTQFEYKELYGGQASLPGAYIGDYVNYGGYYGNNYYGNNLNYDKPTPHSFLP